MNSIITFTLFVNAFTGFSNTFVKPGESEFWDRFFDRSTQLDKVRAEFILANPSIGKIYAHADLEKINSLEMEKIESLWELKVAGKLIEKKERRKLKSRFFSNAISDLNRNGIFTQLKILDALLKKSKEAPTETSLVSEFWYRLENHPVIGTKAINKFDPSLGIGFCFARAMVAHKLLMDRKVNPSHIYKIFAVGQMNYEGVFWRYHVATFVWSDKGFVPLDLLVSPNTSMKSWFEQVDKIAFNPKNPQIRYYLARPSVFNTMDGHYKKNVIFSPYLRPLFRELTGAF